MKVSLKTTLSDKLFALQFILRELSTFRLRRMEEPVRLRKPEDQPHRLQLFHCKWDQVLCVTCKREQQAAIRSYRN